ncbi:glycosyltransferase family 2 protein [Demequina sp. TTPB684]|uniref:glycosyltransferase family 2 protein n=1 Tax=unclassified Demequina TaxID=2620311 RepID=UPI001CF4D6B7|nr:MULTISPECIES: glycosyltransferase family 2 protein [unclassified Demequina]MCB2413540.1 glycosyltransferase family 2 protein [Demequina sp. TTPB684]UPU87239.1 glycosyltransferase family 2 protein [Demequina sp. TMPB413]
MVTLSVIVPSYNAAGWMERCVDSLLAVGAPDIEILIVDDGSTDATGAIADCYEAAHPGVVKAVHKPNGGHGSTINTGLAQARGAYFKVVDSDDWVDVDAFAALLTTLRDFSASAAPVDLVVSNFVYEKVGSRRQRAVRYRNVLPKGRVFGWDEVGRFRTSQYLMMHSLVYRTEVLRESGLQLPEHTFYVDNLYVYEPLLSVRTLYYLDVDLYRYFIGRPDQSVNEHVMIRRIDQQLKVNRMMMDVPVSPYEVPDALYRYLLHHLRIVCVISSTMLLRSGRDEDFARKVELWRGLRYDDPVVYRRLRRSTLGHLVNLPGRPGRSVSMAAYRGARWALNFN